MCPTIQERIEEATQDKMEEFDEWLDDWLRDSKSNQLIKKNLCSTLRNTK